MTKKKSPFVIRSAYGPKERFGDIGDLGQSLTKQSFTDECDINNIMRKYQKTGAIEHVNKHEASYGFATSDTFQESLEIVAKAKNMFEELPSSIRTKFENDPSKFLDFVQNPENLTEMRELGLAHKLQPEQSIPAKQSEATIAEGDAKPEAPPPTEPPGAAKTGDD